MSNIDIIRFIPMSMGKSNRIGKPVLLVGLLSTLIFGNLACTSLQQSTTAAQTDEQQAEITQPLENKELTHDQAVTDLVEPSHEGPSTGAEHLNETTPAVETAVPHEPAEIQPTLAEKMPQEKTTSTDAEPSSKLETNTKSSVLTPSEEELNEMRAQVDALCLAIGSKLGSVSIDDCLSHQMIHGGTSTAGRSLSYRDFPPVAGKPPLGKILILGGIHGDEFSSVSVMFKWMNILNQHHSGLFHWRFVPSLNPDGLLKKKSQRQNELGVDLNRNFPTLDWSEQAHDHWVNKAGKNARRYPGEAAASETETQWLVGQINTFKPDVIISMHAPYHLVDYDGPPTAPDKLGGLYLRKLGVYPGSLGNYAGVDLELPIVTVELKAAGTMPTPTEINRMWTDLVRWLRRQLTP